MVQNPIFLAVVSKHVSMNDFKGIFSICGSTKCKWSHPYGGVTYHVHPKIADPEWYTFLQVDFEDKNAWLDTQIFLIKFVKYKKWKTY